MVRFYNSGHSIHTDKNGTKTHFSISRTGMTWPNLKDAMADWGAFWKFELNGDIVSIYSPRGKHGELRQE